MTANATVTVKYGDREETFELDGTELSAAEQRDGSIHRYLTNASRDHIADSVEKALIAMAPPVVQARSPWDGSPIVCNCGSDKWYDEGRSLMAQNYQCVSCGRRISPPTETGMSS